MEPLNKRCLEGAGLQSRRTSNQCNGVLAGCPILDSTYPLTQTREALTHMQTGSHFGKIVLSLKD
jgi:hypothetical protein